jgi:hypothetical protein
VSECPFRILAGRKEERIFGSKDYRALVGLLNAGDVSGALTAGAVGPNDTDLIAVSEKREMSRKSCFMPCFLEICSAEKSINDFTRAPFLICIIPRSRSE